LRDVGGGGATLPTPALRANKTNLSDKSQKVGVRRLRLEAFVRSSIRKNNLAFPAGALGGEGDLADNL